jgi:hypothetical protein
MKIIAMYKEINENGVSKIYLQCTTKPNSPSHNWTLELEDSTFNNAFLNEYINYER